MKFYFSQILRDVYFVWTMTAGIALFISLSTLPILLIGWAILWVIN